MNVNPNESASTEPATGATGEAEPKTETAGQSSTEATPPNESASTEPATDSPAKPLDEATREDYARIIATLREENATRRVANKTAKAEVINAALTAMGLPESETPAVEELIKKITESAEETNGVRTLADQRARLLAVYRHAPEGVDVNALLDSNKFANRLDTIDPEDETALTALITETVEADNRFVTRPPAGSGFRVDHSGNGQTATKPIPLADAIADAQFRS